MAEPPGFFSREAGQARRRALNEFLNEGADYFLGPTGIPDRLRSVGELLNPVAAMEEASVQAGRAADPELPGRERLGAAGMSAANVAMFGIPGVLAARGFMPTTEAVAETLTGIGAASPSVQEAVRIAVERANQPGQMPTLYSNPIPGIGDNGGPPIEEPYNPLPDLGSRALTAAENLPQARGTYGQMRAQIVKLGGGEPAERELFFTGLDNRFRPGDPVTQAELVDYLRETTPMFSAVEDRAVGELGAIGASTPADETVMMAAMERFDNTPEGRAMFSEALEDARRRFEEEASNDPNFVYDEDDVLQTAQEDYQDIVFQKVSFYDDADLYELAGITPPFDPGTTQYSEYFTPGMTDYRERRYSFTDPAGINPTGIRGYSGAGAHFAGDENVPFLHTRVATADAMGGRGNAYHIGEIQSDLGQGLRNVGPNYRPAAGPDAELLFSLAEGGTGRDITDDMWRRLQEPEFAQNTALPENFFENYLVLNPEFTPPTGERFTRAVSNARVSAMDQLRRGADQLREQRIRLDEEAQEARRILSEGLEVEGSYLGYDSAGGAMGDITRTIRSAFSTGQDPVRYVAEVYDIDPTRSEREQFLLNQIEQYANHSYLSENRRTREGRAEYLSEQLSRRISTGRSDESEMEAVVRSAFNADIPEEYRLRMNRGERISDDELEVISDEHGSVVAAGIAGQQELTNANIHPRSLIYLSTTARMLREGTRSPQPFVESTNQWVDYALRNELANAAREGRSYVTIGNPRLVRDMTYGLEEGQGAFYGEIVPQRLLNIIKKLDKGAVSTMDPQEFRTNPSAVFGPGYIETPNGQETVFTVRLTPDLRKRILGDEERGYRGLTTFLRPETVLLGGAAAGAATQQPEE
jgi:hypothetical protein